MIENNMGTQILSAVAAGKTGTVVALTGGRHFQHRLASMGIHVGCDIEILHSSNDRRGPILVAAGETRLAIGQGMADKILVAITAQERPSGFLPLKRFHKRWLGPFCRRMKAIRRFA